MLRLAFLGQPSVTYNGEIADDFVSGKATALLAYLSVKEGEHPRSTLANLLWGETPTRRANASLRQALYSIRQNLPDAYFVVSRTTVAFDRSQPYWLDVEVLTQALAQSEDEPEQLVSAVDLYRGNFLAGLHFDDAPAFQKWMLARRRRLRLQVLAGLRQLVRYYRRSGALDEAIAAARTQLSVDSLREETHRALMELLAQAGRYNEALRQYERCRAVLESELGVAPMPETDALYARLKSERARSPATALQRQPALSREEDAETTFVGRDAQLRRLDRALDGMLDGHSQLLFVTGEAGSGKSALLREFARRAQIRRSDLLVAASAATGYTGVGDPYGPFRALLAQLTGDVDAAVAGKRIGHQMARRLRDAATTTIPLLVENAPDLIDRLVSSRRLYQRAREIAAESHADWLKALERERVAADGAGLEQLNLFAQYTRFLATVAARRPLLLIIDNLHWADNSSIHLLFHLGQRIGHHRLLLLGAYRPEALALADGQHPLSDVAVEFKRQYGDIWIDLDGFSPVEGRAFVDAYLDAEPNKLGQQFRHALYEQTRGHPLFVRELLDALKDHEELWRDEADAWVTDGTINWEILPSKAEGVIETRMRRLSEESRQALTIASVEGDTFTAEVVAAVKKIETPTLIQQLRELQQTQRLILELEIEYIGGRPLSRYRFRHTLFRTYLYTQAGDVERAHLHGYVGEALESLYGAEAGNHAVELAYHFRQARRLKKAIAYLAEAGRQARRIATYDEAIDYFRQALALLARLQPSAEHARQELQVRVAYGNVLMAGRGFARPEIEENYLRARELCRRHGDRETLLPVLYALHMYHGVGGRYESAFQYGAEFLQASKELDNSGARIVAHRTLNVTLFFQGKFEAAREHLRMLLANYEPAACHALAQHYGQDPGVAGLVAGAWTVWMLGQPERALAMTRRAFAILEEWPEPHTRVYALVFTAALHQFRREPELVRAQVEPAIALAKEKDFRFWLMMAQMLQSWSLAMAGDLDRGIEQLAAGIEMVEAAGTRSTLTYSRGLLADLYHRAGASDAGLAVTKAALADGEARSEQFWAVELYRLQGEMLRDAGDLLAAERSFRQALSVADEQSARMLALRSAVSLGRLLAHKGDLETACEPVAARYGQFDEGYDTPDLQDARAFLDEMQGSGP